MTSYTVSDIFERVQRSFGDEAGVQVVGDDIIRWINDAQQEASRRILQLHPKVIVLPTTTGSYKFDLPTLVPDLLVCNEVYYTDSSLSGYTALKYVSLFTLNQAFDGWEPGTYYGQGVPYFYTKEAEKLVVFPPPREGTADGLKLHYTRYPIPLTADNSPIDLPEYLNQYLIDFCMTRASEMDEDWQAASVYGNRVESGIQENMTTPEQRYNEGTFQTVASVWRDEDNF